MITLKACWLNIISLFVLIGTSQPSPAKILYPTANTMQLHFQFTKENIIAHDRVINLCLVQPYHTDRTVAKGIIMQGNMTIETNSFFLLASLESGVSASAALRQKVLRTPNGRTGLVYLIIKIRNISGNTTRSNEQLEIVQGGLEDVSVICSVNGSSQPAIRVSFKLNLTDKQINGKKV